MHIVDKHHELGSYRAGARACAVDHHAVKVTVERVERGELGAPRASVVRGHDYDRFDRRV